MPELTRRRSPDTPEECWHIYWGDIRAGIIAKRIGIPFDEDPWGRSCGFYPGFLGCAFAERNLMRRMVLLGNEKRTEPI
jgi:hypothetical protein